MEKYGVLKWKRERQKNLLINQMRGEGFFPNLKKIVAYQSHHKKISVCATTYTRIHTSAFAPQCERVLRYALV